MTAFIQDHLFRLIDSIEKQMNLHNSVNTYLNEHKTEITNKNNRYFAPVEDMVLSSEERTEQSHIDNLQGILDTIEALDIPVKVTFEKDKEGFYDSVTLEYGQGTYNEKSMKHDISGVGTVIKRYTYYYNEKLEEKNKSGE